MNGIELKCNLGAGFIDDKYTLPKDGNAGDILVKTSDGSEWQEVPELKYIILKSSTADSTKQFKIAVNDSGIITATEIVNE